MSAPVGKGSAEEGLPVIPPTKPDVSLSQKTILSLPGEIIEFIIPFMERPSALAFARVHSSFTRPCTKGIWRDIDLFLNPHHGHSPLIKTHAEKASVEYTAWRQQMECDGERRYRADMKEKVREILRQGDRRKFGLVETIAIVPSPDANNGIIQLLDLTSDNVRSITIQPARSHLHARSLHPQHHQTLDVRWLQSGLSFPSLTTVRVGEGAIRFGGFIPLLLDSAPNVTSLDAHISPNCPRTPDWINYNLRSFPELNGPTKITTLRLVCHDPDRQAKAYDYGPPLALLERCPQLQQLSLDLIDLHDGNIKAIRKRVASALNGSRDLTDVYWRCDWGIVGDLVASPAGVIGAGPRRVIEGVPSSIYGLLEHTFWSEEVDEPLPHLEVLYLHHGLPRNDRSPFNSPALQIDHRTVFPLQIMPSFFADGLRRTPRLRIIGDGACDKAIFRKVGEEQPDAGYGDLAMFDRLDKLEHSGKAAIGTISSYTRDGAELLHVWLALRKVQGKDWNPLRTTGQYSSRSISEPPRYDTLSQRAWLEFTEFDGLSVPRDVLWNMQHLEGATDEQWAKRGVEVREETWQVLLDWRESVRSAE